MSNLRLGLNEYKRPPESAAALDKRLREAAQHGRASEPTAPGFVLPIPASKKSGNSVPLALPPTVEKDVFLTALLETPTTKQMRRSPLEWAGATALHIALLATLIIVPLYTTKIIKLPDYTEVPLVAPPAPPPPPPPATAVAPRAIHTPKTNKLTFKVQRYTAPTAIPKKVSLEDTGAPPPDVAGITGGVPGGVAGGEIGGIVGGVAGGTGPSAPPPPPKQKATPKIVRVGSNLKAPRQTYSVEPEYPALAKQSRIHGTVVVEAIIDEHGNVVQAHAISGHPLLIPAALRAVLQWKYEPTTLNGQPISVILQVLVNFN